MKSVALVAISFQLVASLALVLAADRKPLNCANTLSPATFDAFQHVCNAIYTKENYESTALKMKQENRLDIIETCSCALLNHDLAWASMMSHEGETLFLAIKRFINETDEFLDEYDKITEADEARAATLRDQFDSAVQIRSGVSKAELVGLLGQEGERQYYWDRLTQIVRDVNDENNCDKVAAYMQRNFALMLYEPDHMSHNLAKSVKSNSMLIAPAIRQRFSQTCWQLIRDFFPFTTYITRLSDLANNARFFYQLASYSENLYKLRINTLMCKFLEKRNKLASQDEVLKKHYLDSADKHSRPKAGFRSRADLKSRKFVESESEESSGDDDSDDSDYSDDDDDFVARGPQKSRSG